jgi:formate dehydrogenase alpha subunit
MTEAVAAKSESVKFTLDGQSVEVKRGTTILEAATDRGVYIPTLCYLKKLLPIGSCRVCSVEVEGVNGPVMSCNTPVSDDMSVTTKSDSLAEYRKQMMQFILVNHPVDCPICERSGECSLQDRTFEFNASWQAFETEDFKKTPVLDWAALRYDKDLCIMCERCVKICHEIQGFTALEIDGTGNEAKINTVTKEKLDCDFCGQCLSVCPVGAISSAIILSVRSWEINKVESICPHCAVGCSYQIDLKLGKIVRISSDDDIGINNGNLCARGRFGFEAFDSDQRLNTPLSLNGVKQEPIAWEEAIGNVVEKLKEIKQKHGPQSVAVLASENLTNEDAYMLQKVMRTGLGINHIDTMSNMVNSDLNAQMFDNYGSSSQIVNYDEIGKAGSLFMFGCDAANENPVIANMIRTVMRDKGTPLFSANSKDTSDFFPRPDTMMLYKYGTEAQLVASLIKAVTDGEIGGLDPNSMADCVDDPAGLVKSAEFADIKEAAKITGVDLQAIEQTAKALAAKGAPLILIGKEIHDHHASQEIIRALSNLANLTGGKTLVYREHCNSQGTVSYPSARISQSGRFWIGGALRQGVGI